MGFLNTLWCFFYCPLFSNYSNQPNRTLTNVVVVEPPLSTHIDTIALWLFLLAKEEIDLSPAYWLIFLQWKQIQS